MASDGSIQSGVSPTTAAEEAPDPKGPATSNRMESGGAIRALPRPPALDFSYPYGPATFPSPRTTHAGNFWRAIIAHADCSCFRVPDPTFKPTFPGFDGP